jgi:hypothetical protein
LLIEALKPLRVRLADRELHLQPGRPVNVPQGQAERLLSKAPDKVRAFHPDWLAAWRELAAVTASIEQSNPCFQSVLDA